MRNILPILENHVDDECPSDCNSPFRIGHYFSPYGITALEYARNKAPGQRYHGIFLCQARNFTVSDPTERYVTRNEVRLRVLCMYCIMPQVLAPAANLFFALGSPPRVPGDCP